MTNTTTPPEPHGPCSVEHTRVYALAEVGDEFVPGEFAHVLCRERPHEGGPAVCGEWAPDFTPEWFGTGSYEEACTARDLPLCPECVTSLAAPISRSKTYRE